MNAICVEPCLSDDLVLAFPVSYELAMLVYACYGFSSAKNEVVHLYWLQFYYSVMETCDAEFVKCLSEEGVSSNREEEVLGFSKCGVV